MTMNTSHCGRGRALRRGWGIFPQKMMLLFSKENRPENSLY